MLCRIGGCGEVVIMNFDPALGVYAGPSLGFRGRHQDCRFGLVEQLGTSFGLGLR